MLAIEFSLGMIVLPMVAAATWSHMWPLSYQLFSLCPEASKGHDRRRLLRWQTPLSRGVSLVDQMAPRDITDIPHLEASDRFTGQLPRWKSYQDTQPAISGKMSEKEHMIQSENRQVIAQRSVWPYRQSLALISSYDSQISKWITLEEKIDQSRKKLNHMLDTRQLILGY